MDGSWKDRILFNANPYTYLKQAIYAVLTLLMEEFKLLMIQNNFKNLMPYRFQPVCPIKNTRDKLREAFLYTLSSKKQPANY